MSSFLYTRGWFSCLNPRVLFTLLFKQVIEINSFFCGKISRFINFYITPSLKPNISTVPELPYLDIITTVSTWVELMELMSLNFIIVSVRRNMSMSFLVIFEKLQLRKYIELLLSASKCLSMQCYLYCSRRITQYRHLCGQGLSDAGRQKPPPVRTV